MTDKLPSLSGEGHARTYLIGGALGLLIGLLSAYLFARAVDENDDIDTGRVGTIDALRLAVALLAIVRQITDLGAQGKK